MRCWVVFIFRWFYFFFISLFFRIKFVLLFYLLFLIFVNVCIGIYLVLCCYLNVKFFNSLMVFSLLQINVILFLFNVSKIFYLFFCFFVFVCCLFFWCCGRMFMFLLLVFYVFFVQFGWLLIVLRILNWMFVLRKFQEEELSLVVDCWIVFWWVMVRLCGGVEDRVVRCLDSEGVMVGLVEVLVVMDWMLQWILEGGGGDLCNIGRGLGLMVG